MVVLCPKFSMIIKAYTQLPTLGLVWIFLSWASCSIICLAKMPYWSFFMLFQTFNIGPECHYPPKHILWVNMPFSNLPTWDLKRNAYLGFSKKTVAQGYPTLLSVASYSWSPQAIERQIILQVPGPVPFFKHEHTLYVSFLSCVDHTWYGFWVLEIFLEQLRRRTLQKMVLTILPLPTTTQCEDGSPLYLCRVNYYHPWGYQLYSNCLPTMLNTAQLFASTAEHGPTICHHCPTACHHCQTPTNCFPVLPKTDQLFANHLSLRSSD